MQALAIALGGASGALMRFWVSGSVDALLGRGFPYGTLVVNVVGSLLMGFLSFYLLERMNLAPEWRAAILVGFLGAFTTFSAFSMETVHLLENGAMLRALLNMLGSVVLCVAAAGAGLIFARSL